MVGAVDPRHKVCSGNAGQETDGTEGVLLAPPPAVVIGAVAVSRCVQSTEGEGATYRTAVAAAAAAAVRYIIIIIIIAGIDDTPVSVTSYADVISGLINAGICHRNTE